MDEETQKETERKAIEEAKTKEAASGIDDPKDRTPAERTDTSKTPSMVDGALMAAGEMKKENDRKEALLEREEKLAAHKALGGQSEAGQTPVKKEVDSEQYAKDVLAGKINNEKE